MNKEQINNILFVIVAALIIATLYKVFNRLLASFGLVETKAEKVTDKAPSETVKEVKSEIKTDIEKIKKSKVLTAAQKKLLQANFSQSQYKQFADKLYEAFNHIGTTPYVVEDTFAQLKNVADVKNLIAAYGVKQLYIFGLPDGKPSNLIGHLISENEVRNANKGLEKNKVFYKF
jgi:hypothetical protein